MHCVLKISFLLSKTDSYVSVGNENLSKLLRKDLNHQYIGTNIEQKVRLSISEISIDIFLIKLRRS